MEQIREKAVAFFLSQRCIKYDSLVNDSPATGTEEAAVLMGLQHDNKERVAQLEDRMEPVS